MKYPLVNADDWGKSRGINEGILDLARRGIVRRVSVLAAGDFVEHKLDELKAVPGISFGLHFSATFGKSENPNANLLGVCGRFHLSPRELACSLIFAPGEIKKQLGLELNLAACEQLKILKLLYIAPEYLDSHHHIHLIPGVIESLLPILKGEGIRQVRVSWDIRRLVDRIFPVTALALRARSRWLRDYGLESLPCFYPKPKDYEDVKRLRSLIALRPGFEMIVHPAMHHDIENDNYRGDRVREYVVLRELEPLFQA